MSGNGNIVAAGTLNMRSSSNASSNGVFQVFGIPTNSNLAALVGSNYDPQDGIVRFTACNVPALPLSLTFFRGRALYASAITPAVTNLSTTTLTPNFSGSTGTYYVAIGTAVGGTGAQTTVWKALVDGTTALTLAPSLTNGTTYYISGYGSNANGTRTLAVSNTTAFVPLAAPTISANTISNTTFTVTAALPSGATSNVYALYTQAGTFQSSNTTGTFTGLSSNTQYYVTVQAKTAYTASALATSASVWCLAPFTFSAFTQSSGVVTFPSTDNTTTTHNRVVNASNAYGTATTGSFGGTTTVYYYGSGGGVEDTTPPSWTGGRFLCGTSLTTFTFVASTTNTSYSTSFRAKMTWGAVVGSITAPSNITMYYIAKGADGNGQGLVWGGYGAQVTASVAVSAGTTFSTYVGRLGAVAGTVNTASSNAPCGDGTYGCSGGSAWYVSANGSGQGGRAGGGGAATVIVNNGTLIHICGGGGGLGVGNNQANGPNAQGGNGGNGSCSANGYIAGGEGNAAWSNSNVYGHQGGWGGSETISNRNTDWGSPDPTTSYAAGAGGGGYRGTINYVTNRGYGSNGTAWTGASGGGNGGNGVQYFGTTSGGGGGGYGGGGSGTATNQGSTAVAGGGGGGASWSSTACTFTATDVGSLDGFGFAYYF